APEVAVLGAGDCVAHCANPAFDASTWEVWAPLLSGARVAVIDSETVLSPTALATALVEARVTALWLTVGLFNEYVDRLGDAFAGLSHLLVGGDALDPRSVARLLDGGRAPARVVNGYGPTETTTFAVVHEITRSDASGRSIPIGRPIANTRVYVLDGEGQPVPVGVSGELHIGGAGVARGYLGREALTAERFVADPFAGEAGARMYRTGDLVRWRADGTLEYLGRNDQQVKIRGFRVELGEIESALSSRPGVRGAVVVVHADPALGKRLVAYVASDASGADALRRDLSERLPAYMVPSSIMVLPALPLTANGKVDRQRLPAPEAAVAAVHEVPQTPTEHRLAAIWGGLLGLEPVPANVGFFEMGGHSLLATRVASAVRDEFGCQLKVKDMFEHQTVASLAAFIDAMSTHAQADAAPAGDEVLEEMEW
ncbi:non-ribosomal peptide synthetase, partial [Marilutibacter spongiae]